MIMKFGSLIPGLLLTGLLFCGCSKAEWGGRIALFQAEQLFWKTHVQMKSSRISFQARQPYYRKACEYYLTALDKAPHLFNSPRIEEASLTCSNAENQEATARWEELYAIYCQSHPKECEYGDIPMGGQEY